MYFLTVKCTFHKLLWIFKLYTTYAIPFSLLVAIGIEAFNRYSQLKKSEEKSGDKEEVAKSPKQSRQEEVSAMSEFPSIQNVCNIIMLSSN